MTDASAISDFSAGDNSASSKFKQKIIGKRAANGREDVEIIVPLKCLINFWRTLEMSLINCEINLILTWSEKCVLSNDTKATTFAITDTKLYAPVVTLSTQDNAKLLQQLKYQLKVSIQALNPYLDFLIDPSFQGVNKLFVLSFENKDERTVHTKYYLLTIEIKDYNIMINGKNFDDI